MTKKNELNDNANEENIIQKWIETNDKFLEQLIENNQEKHNSFAFLISWHSCLTGLKTLIRNPYVCIDLL